MPPFTDALPYPSARQPVYGRDVVATSQPLAAQAGLRVLQEGGNAMDAAVATAAALTVVEPTSNGIGGDCFALVWTGGGLHGLNASGRAGSGMTPDKFAGQDAIPRRGWAGVTVPGAPSGWSAMAQRFGTRTLAELLAPAVRYAREGFLASPITASSWRSAARVYPREGVFKAWHDTFAGDTVGSRPGRGPGAGEIVRLPDHADTLEAIGETDAAAFYTGELARRIAQASREGGGWLTENDLGNHRPDWVRPLEKDYSGAHGDGARYTLHEIPPNGQGMTAQIALGILSHLPTRGLAVDSPERLHLEIEAMKLAFRDAHRYIADPAAMDIDPRELLTDAYCEARASLVDPAQAQDFEHGRPKSGGTVLLVTADRHGNMVSFIQSNYTGFGSGVVVPGTGISMHNRGCNFTLEAGHPNIVAPGKRPYHTIIPGFVTHADGTPAMAYGVMGGFMQPQGHMQVLTRIADFGQNPQAALDAPRWQVDEGLEVMIEPGFEPAVYEKLGEMGHDLRRARSQSATFGRGQVAWLMDHGQGYLAATDLRADGQAVGC